MSVRLQGGMKNGEPAKADESAGARQIRKRTSEPRSEISDISAIKLGAITKRNRQCFGNNEWQDLDDGKGISPEYHGANGVYGKTDE